MFKVDIDFDEASTEWRRNKKKIGIASFEYVCGKPRKDGKPCRSPPHHWNKNVQKRTGYYIRDWGPCKKHLDQ